MDLTVPGWCPSPAGYRAHPLHTDPDNDWIDANCYTDLWVELLHGLGADPYPVLACTLAVDFEGDQWTFFKPPHADLRELYGITVIELATYRPLLDHCATQLGMGRVPVLEVDAYYLPDVPGTYRQRHGKTTIGVVGLDPTRRTIRYVHNAGCHVAGAADVAGLLRLAEHAPGPGTLPPYLEAAKLDGFHRAGPGTLASRGLALLRRHVADRPGDNPVARFARGFEPEIGRLAGDLAAFDGYAFGTLRQLGAAAAFGARYLRWLAGTGAVQDERASADAAHACDDLSHGAKQLVLKAARAVATGRTLAATGVLDAMCAAWTRADQALRRVTEVR